MLRPCGNARPWTIAARTAGEDEGFSDLHERTTAGEVRLVRGAEKESAAILRARSEARGGCRRCSVMSTRDQEPAAASPCCMVISEDRVAGEFVVDLLTAEGFAA